MIDNLKKIDRDKLYSDFKALRGSFREAFSYETYTDYCSDFLDPGEFLKELFPKHAFRTDEEHYPVLIEALVARVPGAAYVRNTAADSTTGYFDPEVLNSTKERKKRLCTLMAISYSVLESQLSSKCNKTKADAMKLMTFFGGQENTGVTENPSSVNNKIIIDEEPDKPAE